MAATKKSPVTGAVSLAAAGNSKLALLFENELKDMYWVERTLTKTLQKMSKKASSKSLVRAIDDHLTETEQQVKKVKDVFKMLGKKATAKKCKAMAGLIQEAEEIMRDTEKGAMRDAGIIMAGQKIEHYEIASYGTLRSFAKTLGMIDAADLLEGILEEEKSVDDKLTNIATKLINVRANDEDTDS